MNEHFNELIVTAADKKSKSVGSIFNLITDLTSFQDSVQNAVDEQENSEYKSKLTEINDNLETMYDTLFSIAQDAIKNRRAQQGGTVNVEQVEEVTEAPQSVPEPKVSGVSTLSVPKVPLM